MSSSTRALNGFQYITQRCRRLYTLTEFAGIMRGVRPAETGVASMRHFILLVCVVSLWGFMLPGNASVHTVAAPPGYDIIIRDGRVVDGSGRQAFNADVAIKGDRIARIGNLRGAK